MQIPCIIKRRYFKKEVYVVYKIVKKQTLNQAVELMEIHAPYVARKCEPGQFIIIRVDEDGERVPLTIADYDREKETVTIIYQVVGYTTELLSKKAEGDYVQAFFPAPMARITVAAPVTVSPPAYTPSLLVSIVSSLTMIPPHF